MLFLYYHEKKNTDGKTCENKMALNKKYIKERIGWLYARKPKGGSYSQTVDGQE